jgi:hypothetical protein
VKTLNNIDQESYLYDYAGRRIQRYYSYLGLSNKITFKHVYDGPHVIETQFYWNSGYLGKIRFIYGPGMDQPVCMMKYNNQGVLGSTYYYHQDASNSVIGLSSNAGAMVQKYEYDVYGNPTILSSDGEELQWTA